MRPLSTARTTISSGRLHPVAVEPERNDVGQRDDGDGAGLQAFAVENPELATAGSGVEDDGQQPHLVITRRPRLRDRDVLAGVLALSDGRPPGLARLRVD